MSLNSIKFEITDIALLFKNSLVEVNDERQVSPKTEKTPDLIAPDSNRDRWKYLGENKKKALVVVRYPGSVQLPDKQLSFLTKLLAACNLSLGDVAIINFEHYALTGFDKIMNHFMPKVVLLFDTRPAEFGMPMNFPEFQVQGYKDAVFVSSPSLEIIEPDKTLKGKLWICLKKIFNV